MLTGATLKNVYLHITEKCGHHCDFCYAKCGLGGFGHADFANVKRIINLVSAAGVKNISLVGGDPFLYPQIAEVIQYVRMNTKMNIILMTNTARIPNVATKDIAPFVDVVMGSIHSDNPSQHDNISKVNGSYENLISAMKEFQDNGVKIEIAFNITPKTFNQITSSIKILFCKGINVTRFVLQRIAPVIDKDGSIIISNNEYIPKRSQINIAMSQVVEVKENYNITVELVDPFPLCVVDEVYHNLITPCKCGLTDMSINGDGNVTRCGADPNYLLGNILDVSKENPVSLLWQNSIELKQFRAKEYLPEQCKVCPLKIKCGGGCAIRCNFFRVLDKNHLDAFDEENITT